MTEVKYASGKKQITIQDDGSIYLYKDNNDNTLSCCFEGDITRFISESGKDIVTINTENNNSKIQLGTSKASIYIDELSETVDLSGNITINGNPLNI